MQKKLIALAIAGLASSAAFAQSNVTIYGTLDLGFNHRTASGKDSVNDISSASSNLWGIKGTEDLGNGLKAGFVLEGASSTDTGTPTTQTSKGGVTKLFGRQSYLSLSGNFGTALVGRFNTFGRAYSIKFAPSPYSGVDVLGNVINTAGFTISGLGIDGDGTGARISNGVAYVLPTLVQGVTLTVAHSFKENGIANSTQGSFANVNEVSAAYDNGPVSVAYVYHNVSSYLVADSATLNGTTLGNTYANTGGLELGQKEHFFGASYDFGTVKLMGIYQTKKAEGLATNGTDKAWQLGLAAPITARDTVTISYANLDTDVNGTNANKDVKGYALSLKHDLSKRTNLYAAYGHTSNSNGGTFGLGLNPTASGNASRLQAGVQHSF